ncbi:hypothetical protein RN001_012728 [Aquatica leii]|uniref:PiggyBac transposable element-derived protein domain-containing protein n=1 Tax=Aquatica leii TaxID=1421715 RepID=A0AAN7P7U8_9COLE|nr:hypothetical protein RN001_012728 [Aquatica leii]
MSTASHVPEKLFALCGSSGILYDFILYQGSTIELDSLHKSVFRQNVAVKRTRKQGRPTNSPDTFPVSSRSFEPKSRSATPPILKKMRKKTAPVKEVRLDGIGHLPEFDDKSTHSQTRCKYPNCKGKTHTFCSKCKVHLCIQIKQNKSNIDDMGIYHQQDDRVYKMFTISLLLSLNFYVLL